MDWPSTSPPSTCPGSPSWARPPWRERAINTATGAALGRNNEYDFDLIHPVASKDAPDWLKPLQVRGRAALVDQFEQNYMTAITEYRLILNYELTWKGSRR